MIEALQLEFMRNALAAGILVSVVCGVIGTLVVVNRIVFLAGGIAHAAYGGIGLAFFMGWPFTAGTAGVSLLAAGVMAAVTLKAKHRADAMVGVIWAVGMAAGVILLDLTPGYHVDLMSYLFGSILAVPAEDLWQMIAIGAVVILVVAWYYNDFLAMSYDDEFARLRNVPVTFLYCLLLAMIALTIVMIIRVVGLILVIALLTIPPFIAEKFTGLPAGHDGRIRAAELFFHHRRLVAILYIEPDLRGDDHHDGGRGLFRGPAVGAPPAARVGVQGRLSIRGKSTCASAATTPNCSRAAASSRSPTGCGS
jgi:zinc transport system permease protein